MRYTAEHMGPNLVSSTKAAQMLVSTCLEISELNLNI